MLELWYRFDRILWFQYNNFCGIYHFEVHYNQHGCAQIWEWLSEKKAHIVWKKMVMHSSVYMYIKNTSNPRKLYFMWILLVNISGITIVHLGCKVPFCNHRYSDHVLFSLLSFQQRVTVWVWRPTVATPCTVRTICLVVNHRWTLARIVAAASAQLRAAVKTPFMTTMRVIALGVSNIFTLTHLPLDKMAAILQTTCSTAFSLMDVFKFQIKFHWNIFLGV